VVSGVEVRTVETDPDRAAHIRWAFDTYATGDWTLRQLATELEIRGLTQRPTAKRAARPLSPKELGKVLHNPYYKGTVTWKGVEFDGNHDCCACGTSRPTSRLPRTCSCPPRHCATATPRPSSVPRPRN